MRPHDIVVLTPDCLRAAEEDLLCGIRRRSDLFVSECYSSGTWTLPAHSTLVSGEDVLGHGTVRSGDTLPPAAATIPTAARDVGYTTGLVSENPTFGTGNGFGAGMDFVDEDVHLKRYPSTYSPAQAIAGVSARAAARVLSDVLRNGSPVVDAVNLLTALNERYRDEPDTAFPHHGRRILRHLSSYLAGTERLFAVVNLLDTHNPHYCPPPDGAAAVGLDISTEEISALAAASDNTEYVFDRPLPEGARSVFDSWDEVQDRMYDVYRAQAAYADRIVSSWLDDHAERLTDSLVVVVGDHGQLFGEEGMVGHHTSLHPRGIAVPAAVSFPDGWGREPERPAGAVSMTGLALAIRGAIDGEVTSAPEFVRAWSRAPVLTCVDGPTWRIDTLRDRYGPDAPQLADLTVRKIGFVEDGIQTVHACRWGDSEVSTRTYEITVDDRSRVDADPVGLTRDQRAWLTGAGTEQDEADVSDRLEALGYM